MQPDILQYPDYKDLWKPVLAELRARGLAPGDKISHAELRELFGVPDPEQMDSFAEIQQAQFAYLHNVSQLRQALLEEDCVYLRNEHGFGYVYIPPQEQTEVAVADLKASIRKAVRTSARQLAHIDYTALTAEKRRENLDARAWASFFTQAVKQKPETLSIGE